jgi:hypothetical protein
MKLKLQKLLPHIPNKPIFFSLLWPFHAAIEPITPGASVAEFRISVYNETNWSRVIFWLPMAEINLYSCFCWDSRGWLFLVVRWAFVSDFRINVETGKNWNRIIHAGSWDQSVFVLLLRSSLMTWHAGHLPLMTCESVSTLTRIEAIEFSSCGSLRSLCIPASVEVIGAKSLYRCLSLQSVTFGFLLLHFRQREQTENGNFRFWYQTSGSELIWSDAKETFRFWTYLVGCKGDVPISEISARAGKFTGYQKAVNLRVWEHVNMAVSHIPHAPTQVNCMSWTRNGIYTQTLPR